MIPRKVCTSEVVHGAMLRANMVSPYKILSNVSAEDHGIFNHGGFPVVFIRNAVVLEATLLSLRMMMVFSAVPLEG